MEIEIRRGNYQPKAIRIEIPSLSSLSSVATRISHFIKPGYATPDRLPAEFRHYIRGVDHKLHLILRHR